MQEQQIADRAHAYVELGKTDEAIEILGTGLVEFSESASLWSLLPELTAFWWFRLFWL